MLLSEAYLVTLLRSSCSRAESSVVSIALIIRVSSAMLLRIGWRIQEFMSLIKIKNSIGPSTVRYPGELH